MIELEVIKGACTHCGQHIEFPLAMVGELAQCPHCSATTQLLAPPPAKDSTIDKAETVACPRCRAPMVAAGAPCLQCGYVPPRPIPWVRVGAAAAIVLLLVYLVLRWESMDPRVRQALLVRLGMGHAAATPAGQNKSSDGDGSPAAAVPGIGVPGKLEFANPPALMPDGNIQTIIGSVKNTSTQDVFYGVTVKFRLRNSAGAPVGEVKDYTAQLPAGKVWDFKVVVLDPDAVSFEFIAPIRGER